MLITLDKKNKFEQVITAKDKQRKKPRKEMFNLTSGRRTAKQTEILFLTLSDWQNERAKLPALAPLQGKSRLTLRRWKWTEHRFPAELSGRSHLH